MCVRSGVRGGGVMRNVKSLGDLTENFIKVYTHAHQNIQQPLNTLTYHFSICE